MTETDPLSEDLSVTLKTYRANHRVAIYQQPSTPSTAAAIPAEAILNGGLDAGQSADRPEVKPQTRPDQNSHPTKAKHANSVARSSIRGVGQTHVLGTRSSTCQNANGRRPTAMLRCPASPSRRALVQSHRN